MDITMHMKQTASQLDHAELERLSVFLHDLGNKAMNMEAMDGFFASLICNPKVIMPNKVLHHVFGPEHIFDSNAQAEEIVGLVLKHWNSVAAQLVTALEQDTPYVALMVEGENGIVHGNEWARGFMFGVQLYSDAWDFGIKDEDFSAALSPIIHIAHEHDPDPEYKLPEIQNELREDYLHDMMQNVVYLYGYFAKDQYPTSRSSSNRLQKIGRNEPCPCGSGKKYKHCCISDMLTIH